MIGVGEVAGALDPASLKRPVFKLSSAGVPLPEELLKSCVGVSVNLNSNQPGSFSLQVNDPELRWIRAADGLLQEGQRIEIALGYDLDARRVFAGTIVAVGADLDDGGGLMIQVQGFDALHAGTRETDYQRFLDEESDTVIVQQLATNVLGLARVSIALDGSRSGPRFRQNISAFQFLEQLAGEYGCTFWVEDDTLFFRPEREGGVPIPLRRRVDLTAFSVRLSTAGQVAEVEARTWDTTQKATVVATARASNAFKYTGSLSSAGAQQAFRGVSGNSKRVMFANIRAASHEDAQRFADAELRRLRRSLITGDAATVGNPAIRVGSMVVIGDMGRFSGEYVVDSVRHQLNEGGYRTSFQIRQAL
jgi:phage protein D